MSKGEFIECPFCGARIARGVGGKAPSAQEAESTAVYSRVWWRCSKCGGVWAEFGYESSRCWDDDSTAKRPL